MLRKLFSKDFVAFYETISPKKAKGETQTEKKVETFEEIKLKCVESVHEFIFILKEALFRFYKIESIMRSQDDQLTSYITNEVLDKRVSDVLTDCNKLICKQDQSYANFKQALLTFKTKPLTFWLTESNLASLADQPNAFSGTIGHLKELRISKTLAKTKELIQMAWR